MKSLHKASRSFQEHYDYDERLAHCHARCERNEMVALAMAASGAKSELCDEFHIKLLKSMVMQACVYGVEALARFKSGCRDLSDIDFCDCDSDDDTPWQKFVFEDEDEDNQRPVFKIAITHEMD